MHPAEFAKLRAGPAPVSRLLSTRIVHSVATTKQPQSPRAPSPDDDVLLTSSQTRARIGGVSAMCIWRWMRDPRVQFPAPIKINARNYWRLGDLRRWHAKRVTAQAA
jgi:predicted DNA-binding transcriptional regulator AlpA